MQSIREWMVQPSLQTWGSLFLLILLAWLVGRIVRGVLVRSLHAFAARTRWNWDDALAEAGMAQRLAQLAPTLIVQFGVGLIAGLPADIVMLVRNIALACTILFSMLALGALLNALEVIYRRSSAGNRSIKSYLQFIKMAIYIIGAVIIIATLIDRSPLILLSGLGALSAVLLLVFKDTILGFVAGVQLTSNDMLRVGDWIEMPGASADGDVVDIALHTVKVQNWDKTITTIPTWKLITDPFKNWRGMSESGGRRIKRPLAIDVGSVHFLDDEEIARLSQFRMLKTHLADKRDAIAQWNAGLGEPGKSQFNQRRLTNLGTFRAYTYAYLKNHPQIHDGMTLLVRQLESKGEGIPLEIYCFTTTTAWAEYENIQADIFDHLIAILPEFGLRLHQKAAGADIREALLAIGTLASSQREATAP